MLLVSVVSVFTKETKQQSAEYVEKTCVITVGSDEGMAVGHGYGATMEEAYDMAYEIARTFAY